MLGRQNNNAADRGGRSSDDRYSGATRVAKGRGEVRYVTAVGRVGARRDRQVDVLIERRGRVDRARIARGNVRVAILRGDGNRLVQPQPVCIDDAEQLGSTGSDRAACGVATRDDVVEVVRIEPDFIGTSEVRDNAYDGPALLLDDGD